MPFDFLKKKKKEPPQEVGSELQTTPNDVTEPVANDDRLKSNDVTPADDVSVKDGGDVNTPDGQTEIRTEVKEEEVKPANGTIEDAEMNKANGKGAVTFANDIKSAEDGTVDVQTSPPDGTPVTTKSEKSPLIGKDDVNPSKVKDGEGSKLNEHQPGFLCCAIF